MESRVFRRHLDLRRIRDEGNLSQLVAQAMAGMNQELGFYIVDNCPADAYQLLRIRREVHELPNRLGYEVRITLDVGAVTEHPFAHVVVQANTAAEDAANNAWYDMTGEVFEPLDEPRNLRYRQQQAATRRSILENRPYETVPETPEPTPARRHILIDKQPQPA